MPQKMGKGKKKVKKVMHEYKEKTLKSSSGHPVTDRKQAIAIALSEARREEKGTKKGRRHGKAKK